MRRSLLAAMLSLALVGTFGASTALAAPAVRYVGPGGADGANDCLTSSAPCLTIQHAVVSSTAGDTIEVAAGTYGELVNVNKSLTLHGARAGVDARDASRTGLPDTESVLTGNASGSTSFYVTASDVTIDGFTVQGQTNANQFGAGIVLGASTEGAHVLNTIVQDNVVGLFLANAPGGDQAVIQHNVFADNNNPGASSGTGMYTDQFIAGGAVGNVLIDANAFTGHDDAAMTFSSSAPASPASSITISSNQISGNGRGFFLYNLDDSSIQNNEISGSDFTASAEIRIFSGVDRLLVTGNILTGSVGGTGRGIRLTNSDGNNPNSGLTLFANSISGYDLAGLEAAGHTGPVAASANWWGATTSAGVAAEVLGDADRTPWLDSGTDGSVEPGFQADFAYLHVDDDGAQVGAIERIQEGIDLVDPSGTVLVEPGTYADANAILIAKAVELLGPNAGISPNDPATPLTPNAARGAEATIGVTGGTRAIQIQHSGVTVDGLRFTDDAVAQANIQDPIIGAGPNFGGDASGAVIRNNIFDSIARVVVSFNGPSETPTLGATIEDNRVGSPTRADTGCAGATAPSNCGRQLFNPWKVDGLSFQRNVTTNAAGLRDRVRTFNATDSHEVTIADNTIQNTCIFTCFTLAGTTSDATIQGNDVSSDAGNAVQLHSTWATGAVVVDHNVLNVTGDFAFAVDNGAADLSAVHLNRNALGDRGLRNAASSSLDATCNWWGQASGPQPPAGPDPGDIFGPADAVPWLVTADLDGACAAITVTQAAADAFGNEGTMLSTSGSFSDANATISADNAFGTFTDNGDGSWTWSYAAPDEFVQTTITVTGQAANASTATDAFDARADNVSPTATFDAPESAPPDTDFQLGLSSPNDVAADLPDLTYAFDCGSGTFGTASAGSTATCHSPNTPGTITVRGKVLDGDGGSTTYTDTVEVTQPDAALAPAAHGFGNQVVGTASPPFTFTVTNQGTADLHIGGVGIAGANPDQFGIDADGCGGATLAPAGTCDIDVVFNPSTTGPKAARLEVASDDPTSPVSATLSGTGTAPASITIVLDERPNMATDFAFSGDLGAFSLDDDANPALPSQRTFAGLAPGPYSVTQGPVTGWSLVNLQCNTGESPSIPTRTVAINLAAGEQVTCTFTNSRRRPDVKIGKAATGPFAGDNVYSNTVLASQTSNHAIARNQTKSFFLRLQNDGLDADSFKVSAKLTGSTAFTVRFFQGTTNITSKVMAGTYSVNGLAPGASVAIEVRVTAGSTPASATRDIDVTMTSKSALTTRDVVRGHVTRA